MSTYYLEANSPESNDVVVKDRMTIHPTHVMDVDENPETARQFGIMSIPTLMFKKDGQVVKQVAGVHSKAQILAILAEIS